MADKIVSISFQDYLTNWAEDYDDIQKILDNLNPKVTITTHSCDIISRSIEGPPKKKKKSISVPNSVTDDYCCKIDLSNKIQDDKLVISVPSPNCMSYWTMRLVSQNKKSKLDLNDYPLSFQWIVNLLSSLLYCPSSDLLHKVKLLESVLYKIK